MMDAITFLLAPTILCLVLAGIHCYLGLHVLARGVIFVDLSLAQVAAFGATLALLFGFEHGSWQCYLCSLGATFVASGIFALAKQYETYFSQEAIIGIVYALGSAAVILVVDRISHGAEHIKELLVGQILWTTWPAVVKTAAIYACVAGVHYYFRKQFFAASYAKGEGAPKSNRWDFLFYALFGVVITSSVSVAGVLQVFAYLIVPPLLARFWFSSIRSQLLFGWGLSIAVSVVGMALSYALDFPSGAFIVVCFGMLPILALLALTVMRNGPSSRV